MLRLFFLLCLVNYTFSTPEEYMKTNLSDVKVLILQEDTVNIYLNGLFNNIDTCQINNLYLNNYFVSNRSNLKIVCKKHYYDYMLCEKDLILLSLKINNYQECKLVFSTFDNILQIFVLESVNIFKKYIYEQTLYNCLRFFGLYFTAKLIYKILLQDNLDFTNNIYTR